MRNLGLPFDVAGLAPMQRKADWFVAARGGDMAISARPAELRPIRPGCRPTQGQEDEGRKSSGAHLPYRNRRISVRVHSDRLIWYPNQVNDVANQVTLRATRHQELGCLWL